MQPFSVELKKGGVTREIFSDAFAKGGEIKFGDEMSAVYTCADGDDRIEVTLRWREAGGETVSHAEIDMRGPSELVSFRYPWVACGASPFDNLLMSSSWGDCIERPAKTIRDVCTSTSIRLAQDAIRYAENEVIYTYPAIMAMQYMTLYNPSRSVYVASYSVGDETETFHAFAPGKFELSLFIRHYPFIRDGRWISPDCGTAVLGGGWHAAADLYASHMAGRFHKPDSPAWMRESYHGWMEFRVKTSGKPLCFKFEDLPAIYREVHENTGMNELFLSGWHDDGHDTKFPRYIVHEPAGTPGELKKSAAQIKAMGGRVCLYTNARLVDIDEEYYKNAGRRAVVAKEDGSLYIETYGTPSVFAVACPGCREYREQMAAVAARICGEYGAHGMFVDQISCNLDPFCFNKDHWHTKPSNNFLTGIEKELTTIRKTHQEIDPDFHTFSEGCSERFGRLYDVHQGHGEEYSWQIGKSMPEQFSYTFPDYVVTGLCVDTSSMLHAMAQFKPLDIKESCYADRANHRPIKEYIALREQYKRYFLQGRFRDDEGFEYSRYLRLFSTVAADGSARVCLFKPGSAEDTVNQGYVKMPERFNAIEPIHPRGVSVEREVGWTRVSWTGALCYLVARG